MIENVISRSEILWYLVAQTLAPVPLQFKGYWELILKCCSCSFLGFHPFLYLLMYFDLFINIWILVYEFFSYCDIDIMRIRRKSFEGMLWIIFIIFILNDVVILHLIGNRLISIISSEWLSAHLTDFMLEEHLVNHLILCSWVSHLHVT